MPWPGSEVPAPDLVSPERTKDSAKSLNGPCLLEAPKESFEIVRKASPGIFLLVFAQILAAGVGLNTRSGPRKDCSGCADPNVFSRSLWVCKRRVPVTRAAASGTLLLAWLVRECTASSRGRPRGRGTLRRN